MKIRQEQTIDYEEVYELLKMSFATSSHDKGKIIGQVVLYNTDIVTLDKKVTELVLSPICVHPDYFRQGIARFMMEESFRIAREFDIVIPR